MRESADLFSLIIATFSSERDTAPRISDSFIRIGDGGGGNNNQRDKQDKRSFGFVCSREPTSRKSSERFYLPVKIYLSQVLHHKRGQLNQSPGPTVRDQWLEKMIQIIARARDSQARKRTDGLQLR